MRKKLYCQNKLNLHDFSFSFSIIQNNLKNLKGKKIYKMISISKMSNVEVELVEFYNHSFIDSQRSTK